MKTPDTKPLTEAEQKYLRQLNDEAGNLLRQLQAAQQRLRLCELFLREQHEAPEGEWVLNDIQVGFERAKPEDRSPS